LYKIPKLEEYYFQDGKFYMRNKLAKKFKIGAILSLVIAFIFGTNTAGSHITPPRLAIHDTVEGALTKHIQTVNQDVTESEAAQIVKSTMKWAKEFEVDPALLIAIQQVESRFDKHSISSSGALGLMQVIPKWHLDKMNKAIEDIGNPELFNTHTNIYLGTWVLRDCMKQYKQNIKHALGCYNGNTSTDVYANNVLGKMRTLSLTVFPHA